MDKDSQGLLDSSLMASGTASRSEDEESRAGQERVSSQALGTIPKRRSSSRFIKRKKFHDELVESSLAKSSTRAKGAGRVEPGRCSGSEPSSSEEKKVSKTPGTAVPPSPAPIPGLTKRVKKSKQPLQVTKDLAPRSEPLREGGAGPGDAPEAGTLSFLSARAPLLLSADDPALSSRFLPLLPVFN